MLFRSNAVIGHIHRARKKGWVDTKPKKPPKEARRAIYFKHKEERRKKEVEPLEKEKEDLKKQIEEEEKKDKPKGSYDFNATSNSGKWNSANNELESLVQNNRKAFSIYKILIGDYETFKEMKLNIETPYCFMEKSDLISTLNKFIK